MHDQCKNCIPDNTNKLLRDIHTLGQPDIQTIAWLTHTRTTRPNICREFSRIQCM